MRLPMAARPAGVMDEADTFVHAAVRAYATGQQCPPPPADASVWVDRAKSAGVLNPVVTVMRSSGHRVPAEVEQVGLLGTIHHLRVMRDLTLVAEVLDGASIPWAVMKGPALRCFVFENSAVRDYADLDVLVSVRDIRRSVELLAARGATFAPVDWKGAVKHRTAEVTLIMPGGTHLDLHWGLINFGAVRDGFRADPEAFLARRVVREVDGVALATFDDEDLALHTMLHACISGGSTLRWMLDVQQCVKWLGSVSSPEKAGSRALEHGLHQPLRAVVSAAAIHVDPSISAWKAVAGRPTPWTAFLEGVAHRRPPSMPSIARSSPHVYFASTRGTSLRSIRALASFAGTHLRHRRRTHPKVRLRETGPDDAGLRIWLDLVEPRELRNSSGAVKRPGSADSSRGETTVVEK